MASGDSVTLLNSLKNEKKLYDELLKLSVQQKDLIAYAKKDFLLKLLNSKKAIIDKIGKIEKDILPLKEKWAGLRDKSEMDADGQIRATITDIQACLKNLVEAEAENEALMRREQGKIGQQLKFMGEKKKADKAYGNSEANKPEKQPRFLDIKK